MTSLSSFLTTSILAIGASYLPTNVLAQETPDKIATGQELPEAAPAVFEGIPITMEILPASSKEAFDLSHLDKATFETRLFNGGVLELSDTTLTLGKVNSDEKKTYFIAVDAVKLKNSTIVTNGNNFVLFTNKLISDGSSIEAFPDTKAKASAGAHGATPGAAGGVGTKGASGGLVSIHVVKRATGRLAVNLTGQKGGDGGDGATGSKGTTGGRGKDANGTLKVGPFGGFCENGPGRGGRGGPGNKGGDAGVPGAGGDGGVFQLFNIGTAPIDPAFYVFASNGGGAGSYGAVGAGGPGGNGGHGGGGHPACSFNAGGPTGHTGDDGEAGSEPKPEQPFKNGAAGTVIAKNLDLRIAVREAIPTQN